MFDEKLQRVSGGSGQRESVICLRSPGNIQTELGFEVRTPKSNGRSRKFHSQRPESLNECHLFSLQPNAFPFLQRGVFMRHSSVTCGCHRRYLNLYHQGRYSKLFEGLLFIINTWNLIGPFTFAELEAVVSPFDRLQQRPLRTANKPVAPSSSTVTRNATKCPLWGHPEFYWVHHYLT